jgi:transmembrane sensor
MGTNERRGPDVGEKAAELVLRLEARESGIHQELTDWITGSPQHLREFMLSFAIHQQIRKMGARFQSGMQREALTEQSRDTTLRPAVFARRAWAGVLTAVLLIVAFRYYGPVLTLPYEVRSYRLSDGSLMQLNGASIARPDMQARRRSVTLLRGEALFDIKHDPIHPFAVTAGSTTVRAVGTTFDVNLLASDVIVTVQEGSVELEKHCGPAARASGGSAPTRNEAVTLEAGEQASVSSDGCVRSGPKLDPVQLERQLSWAHPRLSFQREPLSAAVNQFNRYNRRQMSIKDTAIRDLRIRGVFDSKDIGSFVTALRILGVKAVFQQTVAGNTDGIILVGMTCRWDGVQCTNR